MEDLRIRLRELKKLTLPLLVEHAFIVLMGLINTAMVASLGEEALAAAGHINNASQLPVAMFAAMTTGGTILVAQAIGARDRQRAASSGGQAVALAAVFSVVLSIVLAVFQGPVNDWLFAGSDPAMVREGYIYFMYINWSLPFLAIAQTLFGVMRGAGDVKNPMFITLLMNVVNIILSYTLIRAFGMHGAGAAMAIARLVGLIFAVKVIISKKSPLRLNTLLWYKPTRGIQKDILTLGVPTGVEQLLFQVGRMMNQMMIIGMGTAVMAANIVAINIMGLILIPGNALSIGLMVMVGQRVGRGEYEDISKTTNFVTGASFVAMLLISLVLLPLGGVVANMFSLDAESIGYFRWLYFSLIIGGPLFWPLSFIIPSALRAVKDVTFTMVVSVATMWTFRIVIGYILGVVLGFGVLGVWAGLYGDWASRSVLFWFRLRRRKWLKALTASDQAP